MPKFEVSEKSYTPKNFPQSVSAQSDFGIIRAYFDLQGATARAHSGMWRDGMRVSEKIMRWSCRMQHPMTCPYVGLHAGAQKQAAARMVRRFSTTGTGMEQGQKDLYLVCVHLFIIHVTHRDKSCLTYVFSIRMFPVTHTIYLLWCVHQT